MTVRPKFLKKKYVSKSNYEKLQKQAKEMAPDWIQKMVDKQWITPELFDTSFPYTPKQTEFNRSLFNSSVLITNNGIEPLEHWKVVLALPDEIVEATSKNFEKKGHYGIISNIENQYFNTYMDTEKKVIEIEPQKKILVGDDTFSSESIFLKPLPKDTTIEIPWKLVSKNFKHKGLLTVHIKPEIQIKRVPVDDDSPLLKDEQQKEQIQDYLESMDDE